MMIILHGHEHDMAAPLTPVQRLKSAGYVNCRVAVEINREIAPCSRHETAVASR